MGRAVPEEFSVLRPCRILDREFLMCIIQVWGEGKKNLRTKEKGGEPIAVPKGYTFLKAGNPALTQAVKKAAGDKPIYVVMKKVDKKFPARPIGLYAPAGLIRWHRKRLALLQTEEHRERLAERNSRRRERYAEGKITEFTDRILRDYPSCPPETARGIAAHTCERGSRRVGTSRTAYHPEDLAVRSHVRHNFTAYDTTIREFDFQAKTSGEKQTVKRRAREEVEAEGDAILDAWMKPKQNLPGEEESAASS